MTVDEIIERVKRAGVIGKGGAGFPAYMKLQAKAEFVLANGVECEPLLSNDKVLMETYPKEIVQGLRLAMQCVGAKKGYLCIKEKYKKAETALRSALKKDDNIEISMLGNFYPAGDEFIMVKEVLGRTVPEGGLPLDVGAVVNNVGTLKKIYKAVKMNENVTRKYVSINGEVKEPKLVNVPLGMKAGEVIALAGGPSIDDYAILSGGPNMGSIVGADDVIKKTTGALIVLPKDHPLIMQQALNLSEITNRAKAACLNCRFCTDMCPRSLIGHNIYPHKIMRAVNLGLDTQVEALTGAFLCSGCGVCENFACYMFLSPRKVCQKIKFELIKRRVKNPYQKRGGKGASVKEGLTYRKIPAGRLKARLALTKYPDVLPFDKKQYKADEVKIMLNQHIGALSVPVVKEGDSVAAGQMVADIKKDKLGATYHSSISGKVIKITNDSILIRR
jgi:Na+-translocating ferredoxin:NAD+ oxidoreductase RnfC subunit